MRREKSAEGEKREALRVLACVGAFSATGMTLSLEVLLGPGYVGQAIMTGLAALLFAALSVGFGYKLAAAASAQER